MNKTEVMHGLPQEVVFCKKCVISNQRPSSSVEYKHKNNEKKHTIGFGEDGICDACKYADWKENKIEWTEREEMLIELCDKYRKDDGSYDCLVPGSGGKDSAYTSHILKYKYGMNPLTVTWAPHLYTDIGWRNMMSWVHKGGFDNILFTPNGKVHSLLTKLAFENLLHPFQPFIIGQRNIAPRFASLYNIPLVFYGENQAEYGNNIEENDTPVMQQKFFATKNPKTDEIILGGVPVKELVEKYGVSQKDLNPYKPVKLEEVVSKDIQIHYLGYYLKWDQQENYYYATEHTGFESNVERTEGSYSKYSSIDDRIDPFHYYTTLIKFGIGRATYDAAQEIRTGKITREEGVALVKRYDDEFPRKYFQEFINYIGISEERFHELVDAQRSPHLWEKIGSEWKLKHQVS